MATRPTADQLRFNSAANGEQNLDTYMEAVEKGGRILGDLLDDLFDGTGTLTQFITFREDPSNPGDLQFQFVGGPWATFTYTPYASSYASEWATKAEDVLVSAGAGGNQVDDYSAKHWAAKAAASADALNDQYLGAFTVNPTLDNDNNPLIDGAVYFNTNDNTLRFYDLAETTWFVFGGSAIPIYEDPNNNLVGGSTAGVNLTVGAADNTLYGMGVANKITTGIGNVILGRNAGPTTNQSNHLYIGNAESDTPLISGDFSTNTVTITNTLAVDTANINNLFVNGAGASASIIATIEAGNDTMGTGVVYLQDRPVSGDSINSVGSLYSTSELSLGYGVSPNAGLTGYHSTIATALVRSALEIGGVTPFSLQYASLITAPVGNTVAMTEIASIDSTGYLTLSSGINSKDITISSGAATISLDGNATLKRNSGSNGNLEIINTGFGGTLLKVNNTATALAAYPLGSVSLYFNDVLAFSTTGTGVTVHPSSFNITADITLISGGAFDSRIIFSNTTNGAQSHITSKDGGDLWFSTDHGSTSALQLSSTNDATFTGRINVNDSSPVLVLNDNVAGTDAAMTAWASLQRGGVEKGWMGFGSAANTTLSIHNNIGNIDLYSNNVLALTLDSAQTATFAGDVNISKGDVDTTLTLGDVTTNARGILNIKGGLATSPYIALYQGGNQRAFIQYVDAGDNFRFDSDNNIQLQTNNTLALTIDTLQKATFQSDVILAGATPYLAVGSSAVSTGNAHIEIGVNRTGDGYSFIDLHSSSSLIDYDARLIRYPGVNGTYELVNMGIGDFNIRVNTSQFALKAAANGLVRIYYNNATAFESASTGMTVRSSSNATYAGITVLANTINPSYIFFNNATNGELSRIRVTNNREFIVSNDNGVTDHLRVNANGYVFANYFNTSPNTVTSGVTQVCVETNNDGFIRHGTAAAIQDFIGMKVLQVHNVEYGNTATGTSLIPIDGTVPQNTEGTQFMTKTITPRSSSSFIKVDVSIHLTSSLAGRWMATSLFLSTSASALAASDQYLDVAGETSQMNFTYVYANLSTAAKTFNVRAGCSVSATTRFNVNHFGGIPRSSITLTEYIP